MFDIVIPLGPNDNAFITSQIEKTRQNVVGYRNIYIVASNPNFKCEQCIVIDENIFPFVKDVAIIHGKNSRNGWYLQQLIKLYAGSIIPGILGRYLVIDADTFFLNPTTFENDDGLCLYNFGSEYHLPYFFHMHRLNPLFKRIYRLSGICHHMIFEQSILEEMFSMVSKEKPFWMVFLEEVDVRERNSGSGASEYELYFNYVAKFHNDKIEIRGLQWANVRTLDFQKYSHLNYISYHHYMRS